MTRSTALLFEPAFLGPLHARNRIVMPAMHLGMSPDGDPGADEVAFYRRRARAGTGTIIVGMCNTEPRAQNDLKGVLDLSDDAHIGPMSLLAAAIRDEGALAGAQLSPACGYNNPAWHPPEADMLPLLDRIGQAAARAAAAGFDFVELMLSGGSLLSHFLSPAHNRWDLGPWSGSLDNRLRAPLCALDAIHRRAPGLPVMVRMHGHEFLDGGFGLEEAARIARALENAGACAIDVTGAGHRTLLPQLTRQRPVGTLAFIGRNIADAVKVPVLFGGRVRTARDAVAALIDAKAAFVTVGRAMIADGNWTGRVEDGRDGSIATCIACGHCLDCAFGGRPVQCTLSPAEGGSIAADGWHRTAPKVLVVGSGPAGLTAACEFASAGCDVTVMEKSDTVGGRWQQASDLDGHSDLRGALDAFIERIDDLGVTIETGVEVTPDAAKAFGADVLVLAAGAIPRRIALPGQERHARVLHVQDILEGAFVPDDDTAVVGGNAAGVALALHLAKRGFADLHTLGYLLRFGNGDWAQEALRFAPARQITILKRQGFAARGLGRSARWAQVRELELFRVRLLDRVTYEEVTPTGICVANGRTGQREFIPAATIVLSTGYESRPGMRDDYRGCAKTVMAAGDVMEVGNIRGAIHSVFRRLGEPDTP